MSTPAYPPPPGPPPIGPPAGYPYPAAPAAPSQRSTVDLVMSIMLMLGVVCAAPLLMFLGGFSAMASDSCMSQTCNYSMLNAGVMIAIFATPVVGIVGIIVTIVMLARRRLGSLWALGTLVLVFATALGGVGLVGVSVS